LPSQIAPYHLGWSIWFYTIFYKKIFAVLQGQSVLLSLLYHIIKCLAGRQKIVCKFATSAGLTGFA
jgi:hypothetical protein